MKKVIFGLAILIIAVNVSACAMQDNNVNNSVNNNANSQSAIDQSATSSEIPASATSSAASVVTQIQDNLTNNSATASATVAASAENKNMVNPEKFADLTKQYSQAKIKTTLGDITVKFYATDSPFTVNNFLNLAQAGFYDGVKFHRVIKDFMIQGGDPLSKEADTSVWGTGGPGYQFKDEFNAHKLVAGSLAMANAGSDTNGSQFFVVTAAATPWLDGHHTNFGEVVAGMDVVRKIEATETGANNRPVKDVVINNIELLK